MAATKMMMMMTNASAEKPTEDTHFTDSSDQSATSSRPSTACSSSDLCTPMPHTMSHTIDPKRLSVLSDSSLRSAGTDGDSAGAPSDVNSNDSPAPHSALPSTPPSSAASLPTQQTGAMGRGFMPAHGDEVPSLHPAMKPWSAGDAPVQMLAAKSSDVEGLYPSSADNAAAYDAFTSWRSQPVGQQPILDYQRGPSAHMGGASGHSRTASYQSTLSSSSIDSSWSGSRHSGSNPILDPYVAGLTTPLAQMSLNPMMPTMSACPPGLPGRFRQARLAGLQGQMPVPEAAPRCEDSRTLADSLATLSAAYGSPQMAYGAYPRQYLDPAMMAYSGALAAAPLLELYGITPEMLSARSGALSRLATGAAPNGGSMSAATGATDEGPSPTNKKTNLYKTELCRSWEEKGSCRYGSKCQFAHGQDELRSVNRHPKFKTEICRTFWLHGSCPYGKRCCFLHTTATDAGTPPASGANAEAAPGARNAHDPPTSRLQQRTSSGPGPAGEKALGLSLSPYVSSSPRLQSAPPIRSQSELGHSRSSSTSRSSQTSSIDGLRIQIGPRFGPREQVPAQDAPGPRSRLERLRPTSDYADSTSSMPTTSSASTTRYSPFLDRHQPPHSAFSDISSVLTRSPSRHISKAHSANGDEEVKWPSSRLSGSSTTMA